IIKIQRRTRDCFLRRPPLFQHPAHLAQTKVRLLRGECSLSRTNFLPLSSRCAIVFASTIPPSPAGQLAGIFLVCDLYRRHPTAIQNQQLMSQQRRLGNDGAESTWSCKSE